VAEGETTPPVLVLRGLCKSFQVGQPNEVQVLHDVDLTLHAGEFVAIMGPSGSGKSTLLHLVGLLDRPTRGDLRIAGASTTELNDGALTRLRGDTIGFVFQYHHLLGSFTALENVLMPLYAAHGWPLPSMRARARALLDRVGLSAVEDRPAIHLSGGQQQRVALARALVMGPRLLLADEPTGNLDSHSADAVFDLLRQINREQAMAVLFVTHNAALAARCDRIVRVVDGRVAG
jgi:lipoprotein-releasing system ATP-binding protein